MDFERLYQTAGWIAVILASLPFVNGRTASDLPFRRHRRFHRRLRRADPALRRVPRLRPSGDRFVPSAVHPGALAPRSNNRHFNRTV